MTIHKLPGTYMLRELQDVTVPDAISWQPQTAGWLLLALLLGALALLWLYHRVQRWWQQRYRREALAALRTLNWSDAGASLGLFHIIKAVLTHLDPRHAKLFGMALLQTLDNALPERQPRFATELGERWLVSLVCDQVVLSVSDQLCLVSLCSDWLAHHQPPFTPLRGQRRPAMLDAGLEFAHPHCFWLLPLPLLVFRLIPAYRTRQSAIKVPFFTLLIELLDEPPQEGATQLTPSWWQRVALITVWLLAVVALAKPTIYGPPQVRERFGRDVMIVLDLSGSMAETDFSPDPGKPISRLDAAKGVLEQFAATREGDRLGLILFGDAAFIQAPFTADLDTWQALLQETDVAMAGQSTHLGDAIGLAIKVFRQSDRNEPNAQMASKREKVVIILTDGNDTGSFVSPRDAARVAAVNGVRLHTIAMGDPATVGEQALDLDTLQQLATLTGGQLFQALDQAQLTRAYQVIGELEPQRYESTRFQTRESLHHYLIAACVGLYLGLFSLLTLRRYRLRPARQGDTHD